MRGSTWGAGIKLMLWYVLLICSISLVCCIHVGDKAAIRSGSRKELSLRMRGMKQWTLGLAASLSVDVSLGFNAPADVPTWCGKPYMSS